LTVEDGQRVGSRDVQWKTVILLTRGTMAITMISFY